MPGRNIPVREDFSAVALVHVFFLPFGKISQKKFKPGVTKQGGNLDNQWCGEVFFEFFSKVATQLGDVLEITPVEGLCKPPLGRLLLR